MSEFDLQRMINGLPADEPVAPVEDAEAKPEMPVEVAREVVEGPSLAAAVASGAPVPVIPDNSARLGGITGKALDKMAEILGMTREQMLAMPEPEFERSIAWAKLQLNASEVALRTQVRVDENRLKAQRDPDGLTKLLAIIEEEEERLAKRRAARSIEPGNAD